MATVSPAQVTDGTTMDASDVNNPINTIANEFNGNIDNSNIKSAAAIDASKIAGGITGMFGAWTSYTPTWTNLTVGNGTLTYAKYIQVGKTVYFRVKFTVGSTTAVGSAITLTAPVTMHADYVAPDPINAVVAFYDLSATTTYLGGEARVASSTTLLLGALHTDGSRGNVEASSGGDPVVANLATGDIIYITGIFEAA